MTAIILRLAACIADVVNKVKCRTRVYYVVSQPFSALYLLCANQHGCTRVQTGSKNYYLYWENNHTITQPTNESICKSTFSGQLASSIAIPFQVKPEKKIFYLKTRNAGRFQSWKVLLLGHELYPGIRVQPNLVTRRSLFSAKSRDWKHTDFAADSAVLWLLALPEHQCDKILSLVADVKHWTHWSAINRCLGRVS